MIKTVVLLFCLSVGAFAQQWNVGLIGGFGYAPKMSITNGTSTANAGFQNGLVAGIFLGQDNLPHWGAEARYLYRVSNLSLSSGGTSTKFDATSQIVHFDFLYYPTSTGESRVRPFAAFGGGVRFMEGTGTESATQPLGRFAALTATRELLGVGDVGVGVKVQIARSLQFRVEVRDYISPAPTKVIATAPGGSVSALFHDVIGMASVAYTW